MKTHSATSTASPLRTGGSVHWDSHGRLPSGAGTKVTLAASMSGNFSRAARTSAGDARAARGPVTSLSPSPKRSWNVPDTAGPAMATCTVAPAPVPVRPAPSTCSVAGSPARLEKVTCHVYPPFRSGTVRVTFDTMCRITPDDDETDEAFGSSPLSATLSAAKTSAAEVLCMRGGVALPPSACVDTVNVPPNTSPVPSCTLVTDAVVSGTEADHRSGCATPLNTGARTGTMVERLPTNSTKAISHVTPTAATCRRPSHRGSAVHVEVAVEEPSLPSHPSPTRPARQHLPLVPQKPHGPFFDAQPAMQARSTFANSAVATLYASVGAASVRVTCTSPTTGAKRAITSEAVALRGSRTVASTLPGSETARESVSDDGDGGMPRPRCTSRTTAFSQTRVGTSARASFFAVNVAAHDAPAPRTTRTSPTASPRVSSSASTCAAVALGCMYRVNESRCVSLAGRGSAHRKSRLVIGCVLLAANVMFWISGVHAGPCHATFCTSAMKPARATRTVAAVELGASKSVFSWMSGTRPRRLVYVTAQHTVVTSGTPVFVYFVRAVATVPPPAALILSPTTDAVALRTMSALHAEDASSRRRRNTPDSALLMQISWISGTVGARLPAAAPRACTAIACISGTDRTVVVTSVRFRAKAEAPTRRRCTSPWPVEAEPILRRRPLPLRPTAEKAVVAVVTV